MQIVSTFAFSNLTILLFFPPLRIFFTDENLLIILLFVLELKFAQSKASSYQDYSVQFSPILQWFYFWLCDSIFLQSVCYENYKLENIYMNLV